MAIYGDGKHDSDQTEYSEQQTTFTVSIDGFTDIDAKTPLDAAKEIRKWIMENNGNVVFTVTNEQTNEKFTVDLAEDDEDAVLPYWGN